MIKVECRIVTRGTVDPTSVCMKTETHIRWAAHSSFKAVALSQNGTRPSWDSAAPLRPLTCFHPSDGADGSCGSGYSFRAQHLGFEV